jgi:hypothetical protein
MPEHEKTQLTLNEEREDISITQIRAIQIERIKIRAICQKQLLEPKTDKNKRIFGLRK